MDHCLLPCIKAVLQWTTKHNTTFQPAIQGFPANQALHFFRDDPDTEKTLFTSIYLLIMNYSDHNNNMEN